MALTRARVVLGDPDLTQSLDNAVRDALMVPRDLAQIFVDSVAMRERMRAARGVAPAWDLKHRPGGLIDIEFIAQTLQLAGLQAGQDVRRSSTFDALTALGEAGLLPREDAQTLCEIGRLYLGLMQLIRTAHGSGYDLAMASRGFATRLANLAGEEDLPALEDRIERHAAFVRQVFSHHLEKSQS